MDKLYYKLKLLSPIILSKNQGDMNSVPTSDEFSGTAIIGALASKYFQTKKTNDINEFNLWFLSGTLKFHHAKILKNRNVFVNKPFSVLGKKNPKREKGKIIERDLIDSLLISKEEEYKYKSGLLSLQQGVYTESNIDKTFNFHHARDPETGYSKEGKIFNYESLDAGQEFAGYISGSSKDLNDFKNWFGEKQILYFGRSRNSQYGKVEFALYTKPIYTEYKISKQDLFEERTSSIENDYDKQDYYFLRDKLSITLITDTILLNEFGFSSVTQSIFESYIQSSIDNNIKIEKSFLKSDETRGYNAKWKLRRSSESCFQAGSCFLLDISKCEDKQAIILKIQNLLEKGIGERTHEGYGEALLNLQVYETISLYEEDETTPEKPKVLNEEVKEIIKQVYTNQFISLSQKKAMDDIETIKNQNLQRLKGTSTSIVSRLEGLINEENGTLALFKDNSEVLKNTAKKKLERIRFNNQRLYDYFLLFKDESNSPVSIQDFLKKNDNQKLQKLRDSEFKEFSQNGKTFLQEEKFEKELNRQIRNSYLKHFFSSLRKQIKLSNKSSGERNE